MKKNIFVMIGLFTIYSFIFLLFLPIDIIEYILEPFFLKLSLYSAISCIIGILIGATAYFLLQTGQKILSDNLCIFLQVITSFAIYLFLLIIW